MASCLDTFITKKKSGGKGFKENDTEAGKIKG
jgi:hypothetical protein